MAFTRVDPKSIFEKYIKSFNFIKESISNIQDQKTLDDISSAISFCQSNTRKIEDIQDEYDEDTRDQFNEASLTFDSNIKTWQSILANKREEFKRVALAKQSEELANMTEEQRLEMQAKDEKEYYERQLKEIEENKNDLSSIYAYINDKYTVDHERFVPIDQETDQESTEKNDLKKQEDQKMDEDKHLNALIQESEEFKNKINDAFQEDHERIVRINHEQETNENQNKKNDQKSQENQKKCNIC